MSAVGVEGTDPLLIERAGEPLRGLATQIGEQVPGGGQRQHQVGDPPLLWVR